MEQKKNVFGRGADYGAILGMWLTVMALAWIYADKVAPLAVAGLIMAIVTPVVVYRFQSKEYVASGGKAPFADLWMLGILMFICGSLITGLVTYSVFQWLRPEFIRTQAELAAQIYESEPSLGMAEAGKILRDVIEQGALPSPIQMVMSLFWFTTFGGSVLSALTAVLARAFGRQRQEP